MAIRGIDLQVLLGKTPDVERAQQIQQQSATITQGQIVSELQKEKEIQQKQVLKAPAQEEVKVEEKKGRGNRPEAKKGKKGKESAQGSVDEEQELFIGKGNVVDLKI